MDEARADGCYEFAADLRAAGDGVSSPLVVHVEGLRLGAAGQALDENVGTARGVKRARDVGASGGSGVSNWARTPTGFDSSSPSSTSRIRGDLDVRVPRRSARARASVRRWPWSSRRGRNGDNWPLYALNWTRLSCHRFAANRVRCLCSSRRTTLGTSFAGCVCPRPSSTGRCGACRSS